MHIKDHNDAMTFFRNSKQLESNGKWKEFVEESKFDDMLQESRTLVADASTEMEQSPNSFLRPKRYDILTGSDVPAETLEDWDTTFRRPNAHGGVQQLVRNTVDGSRPGYAGMKSSHLGGGIYENTSKVTGKKTYFGKVQRNKKLLKSPHGTKEDAIKFVTEKRKIHPSKSVIVLQAEQGTLLEQPKYKKALTNALDDLANMETKGYGAINEIVKKYQNMFSRVGEKTVQGKIIEKGITTESRAITNAIRSYAAENNIRDVQIKEMEKALDNYLAKKIPERGYIPKLMKKHGIPEATFNSWLIELDARRKIPLKYKNESEKIKAVRAKRDAALKKYSSPGFERWTKGTAESGLQGGHTGQIYSEEVTPKTKKFTPAKINQETLKKYDALLEGITSKRDKAFKAKNWAEVERLNKKGMEYASATEGYKTFTIKNRDGTKFTWGSTTKGAVDPMDLTKEGITAKEMESWRMGKNPIMTKAKKDFKNKIISKAELETINAAEEAKLFAEGKNKALLEFQRSEALQSAKMSKKEISAMDKRLIEKLDDLKNKDFSKTFSKTFQDLSPQSVLQMGRTHGCLKKQEGGSIIRCLQTKFNDAPEKFLQRSAPLVKNNVNLRKWFLRGRNIARGTGVFAAWEAVFAPVIAGWGKLEGDSHQRILHDLFYGSILEGVGVPPEYVPGINLKEEFMEYAGGGEKAEKAWIAKRMDEIQGEELPYLQQQLNDAINRYSHVEGKGYHQRVIEDDIKEKELELQDLWNKSGFEEGPAGGALWHQADSPDAYFNMPAIIEADQTYTGAKDQIAADTAERKKAAMGKLKDWRIIADKNWQAQVPKAKGGIMSLKKKKW